MPYKEIIFYFSLVVKKEKIYINSILISWHMYNPKNTEIPYGAHLEESRTLVGRAYQALFNEIFSINCRHANRILELGSGTGFLSRNWPQKFDGNYVQFDISEEALGISRGIKERGFYVAGNADNLPFPDNSFDVIGSMNFLDVFSSNDLEKVVKECHRVLRSARLLFHISDVQAYPDLILNELKEQKGTGKEFARFFDQKNNVWYIISFDSVGLGDYKKEIAYLTQTGISLSDEVKFEIAKKHGEVYDWYSHVSKKLEKALKKHFDPDTYLSRMILVSIPRKKTKEESELIKGHVMYTRSHFHTRQDSGMPFDDSDSVGESVSLPVTMIRKRSSS